MIPDELVDAILEASHAVQEARAMRVKAIIDGILAREGGYVDHPADPGGPTKYGITARTLGAHRHLGRQATRAEVKALNEWEARDIYEQSYVRPFRNIPAPLQVLLIDWGVTTSRPTVIKALQVSMQSHGYYAGSIDGVIGPLTRGGLAEAPIPLIYTDVLAARMVFYESLAFDAQVQAFLRAHPKTKLHFLRGWSARCREFLILED